MIDDYLHDAHDILWNYLDQEKDLTFCERQLLKASFAALDKALSLIEKRKKKLYGTDPANRKSD